MVKIDLKKLLLKEAEKFTKAKVNSLVYALKDATPVDTGRARDGWYTTGDSIRNDVEYVDDLNQGTSKQAPVRFIEKTVLSQSGVKSEGVIVRSI